MSFSIDKKYSDELVYDNYQELFWNQIISTNWSSFDMRPREVFTEDFISSNVFVQDGSSVTGDLIITELGYLNVGDNKFADNNASGYGAE